MTNINVRGLPPESKEALRVRAARAGLSLEAYARRVLQMAANQELIETSSIADLAECYFGPEFGIELELPDRKSDRDTVDFSE